MEQSKSSRGISGKTVLIVFFAFVAVMAGGLWIVLDANRDELVAQRAAMNSTTPSNLAGWYHVTLVSDDGPMPFLLEIPQSSEVAYVRNGTERIQVQLQQFEDGALLLDFPHYDSRVTLSLVTQGMYEGAYYKVKSATETAEMPAIAQWLGTNEPAILDRFEVSGTTTQTVAGQWRMDFADADDAKAILAQEPDGTLTGTIITSTGDFRYLAGEVLDNSMRLSVFDGSHAFLFTADISDNGQQLTNGVFNSGGYYRDTFTAQRIAEDDPFEPLNPFDAVTLQPGVTKLSLAKLREPPYADAPTLVVAFGTWCPNCHDEAPFLKALYDEYHDQGLQILGLAYERSDDVERSLRQIARFKERYGITWEILPAGDNDKAGVAASLPALSSFKSYPTTIFVNRDRTVQAILSGYVGPAAGDQHVELHEAVHGHIRAILAP